MGLYDRLTFEDGLDIEFPDVGANPFEITWQTKSLARRQPMMEHYKVTADGRPFEEDIEYERVPEEERPGYNEETDGLETPLEKMRGSQRTIHHGWTDTEYHGTFEFHATVDGEYVSLDAKFTDGRLVAISRTN